VPALGLCREVGSPVVLYIPLSYIYFVLLDTRDTTGTRHTHTHMAQVVPTASPSSLLLTPDAPYSVYLRALKHEGWGDYGLEYWLQRMRDNLDSVRGLSTSRRPSIKNSQLAAVVDIRSEQGVDDVAVVVAQLDKVQIQGERVGTINSGVTDDFLDSLRTCAANVHTRIIILQDLVDDWYGDDRKIERLFTSHLLGIELNLSPAYVCGLLQDEHYALASHMRRYPGLTFDQCRRVALYLGPRKFGDGNPYTGECM
jgi:hypothetical protein